MIAFPCSYYIWIIFHLSRYLRDTTLEYPLGELEKFFQSVNHGEEPPINGKTAYIFAYFVEKKVEELRQIAQGIDEDYSS